jgi:hypothetical protein
MFVEFHKFHTHQLNLKHEPITPSHEYVEPCEHHKHQMTRKKEIQIIAMYII